MNPGSGGRDQCLGGDHCDGRGLQHGGLAGITPISSLLSCLPLGARAGSSAQDPTLRTEAASGNKWKSHHIGLVCGFFLGTCLSRLMNQQPGSLPTGSPSCFRQPGDDEQGRGSHHGWWASVLPLHAELMWLWALGLFCI